MYYTLGQLVGCSIVTLGRGPEALHPIIVRELFNIPQPFNLEFVDDGLVNQTLLNIDNDNYDALYDLSISPAGKSKEELKNIYILTAVVLSKSAAITQFKEGMSSIAEQLVQKRSFNILQPLMEDCHQPYSFGAVVELINYPQAEEFEIGSNLYSRLRDAITQMELLLVAIEANDVQLEEERALGFEDFLFFITGTDRIPPHGFQKKLDIRFDDISLPKSNTCGLSATFPYVNIRDTFVIAIRFGGGYGNI